MAEKEERSSAIVLDEIEEIDEPSSGNESDGPESSEEMFSGNELDEAEDIDKDTSENELGENEGRTSENYSVGSESKSDEPQNRPSKSIADLNLIKEALDFFRVKKNRLGFFVALGLVCLSSIGYLFVRDKMHPVKPNQVEGSKHVVTFEFPKGHILEFGSFVIPFNQNAKFCYLTLTVAFKLHNNELRRTILQDKSRLRGIIYDALSREINGLNDVPSLEKIKHCIKNAVNGALSMEKIKGALITHLTAV